MKLSRWHSFLPVLALALPGAHGLFAASCAIPDAAKKTVVDYVQKKYRLPDSAGLRIAEDTLVGATCYHKLRFQVQAPQRAFSAVLYLSPDAQFLTTDLLDSRTDPLEEERRRNQEVQAKLTQGTVAAEGPADAAVTLVVFADFQCPFCQKAAQFIKNERLTAEGKNMRVIFRHFPLSMHPWAKPAAEAAACAGLQNPESFWKMHDSLFENQKSLKADNVSAKALEYAHGIAGFDMAAFQNCMDNEMSLGMVLKDSSLGSANQVSGTPTLFLNGRRLPGIRDQADLHAAIVDALRDVPSQGRVTTSKVGQALPLASSSQ